MGAGSYHSALLTHSGNLYVAGWSELGQTGLSKTCPSIVESTRIELTPSLSLDISRGTTSVKLFLSSSADNSFILLRRSRNTIRFFNRLYEHFACSNNENDNTRHQHLLWDISVVCGSPNACGTCCKR